MLCINNRLLYKLYMQAHIINLKTYQSGDVDFTADKPGEDPVINSHTHNTHTYTWSIVYVAMYKNGAAKILSKPWKMPG